MTAVLPQSRPLNGFIMAVEGVAVWVVAVFLSSFYRTGWLLWPGTDMYTTAVGTMRYWLTTGGVTPFEIVGYLGLVIGVAGPVWFWMIAPTTDHFGGRSSAGFRSAADSREMDSAEGWDEWISATELAEKTGSVDHPERTDWEPPVGSSKQNELDSIQAAIATGDFFRGSGTDSDEMNSSDSSG